MRWWSRSSRSKHTLFGLTPEVKARRKSELVRYFGTSRIYIRVFGKLGSANRSRHWRIVSM